MHKLSIIICNKLVALIIVLVLMNGLSASHLHGQNLINTGTVYNDGLLRIKNQAIGLPPQIGGRFELFGSDQIVPAVNYKELLLSGSGNKNSSGGNFIVYDSVIIKNNVILNIEPEAIISLYGYLREDGYLTGSIQKSEQLYGGITTSDFGNIGTRIIWPQIPVGATNVLRTSGIARIGNGNESIKRFYEIATSPNNILKATIIFKYADQELNGHVPEKLVLWKSTNNGLSWTRVGGNVNLTERTIQVADVHPSGLWTASDENKPLGPIYNYSTIIIRKFIDRDGNLNTTNDRIRKQWNLKIHADDLNGNISGFVLSDSVLKIDTLSLNKYFAIEADSIGWTHLGYQIENNQPVISTVNFVPININEGQTVTVRFFNFKNGKLSGVAYNDLNRNGIYNNNEPTLPNKLIKLTKNDIEVDVAYTDTDGRYSFSNLTAGNYTVSIELPPRWISTSFPNGRYSINILSGTDSTGLNYGCAHLVDTTMYRTFVVESLAIKKPNTVKPIARLWYFELKNSTGGPINGLEVKFSRKVSSILNFSPFINIDSSQNKINIWKFNGAVLENNKSVNLIILGSQLLTNINKLSWTNNGSIVGKPIYSVRASYNEPVYASPNTANVRDAVFKYGGFPSTPNNPRGGLIVGKIRKDSLRSYGWVVIRRSIDLQQSLLDKSGYHQAYARGLTVFNNGTLIWGEKSKLTPTQHNNKLFAELAALKFNIAASALGVTPNGFGELIYVEPPNPLSGLSIKDIANYADSLMTYWKGVQKSQYANLDTVLLKINRAFSGPITTIYDRSILTTTGVKQLADVPFLMKPIENYPIWVIPPQIPVSSLPVEFSLSQNYPNPFNPFTSIQFSLPSDACVSLKIFDILGREVVTLIEGEIFTEGTHEVEFIPGNISSGVYFYRLVAQPIDENGNILEDNLVKTKKMIYTK